MLLLSRTNIHNSRCHLDSRIARALCRIPSYPRHVTPASRRRILRGAPRLTAPSAVHLTMCFLPDSQLRRLSVKASLPLSPLQRFRVCDCLTVADYTRAVIVCQQFFCLHSTRPSCFPASAFTPGSSPSQYSMKVPHSRRLSFASSSLSIIFVYVLKVFISRPSVSYSCTSKTSPFFSCSKISVERLAVPLNHTPPHSSEDLLPSRHA